MRFRALLFDLDGTLADSHHEICLALDAALTTSGKPRPFAEIERLVDGSPLPVIWDAVGGEQAGYPEFEHLYRERYMRELGHATQLFPGVDETLSRLRERFPSVPLCVVSNKAAQSVTPLLCALQIEHHFEHALGAGGTSVPPKPHPGLLLQAADAVASPPESCVMIGDTTLDVLAGKAAGMLTLAMSYGMSTAEALVQAGADHVLDDFTLIESLLT